MNIISYVEDQQVEVIQRLQLELQDSNYRLNEIAKDRAEIWEEKMRIEKEKSDMHYQTIRIQLELNTNERILDDLRKDNSYFWAENQKLSDQLQLAEHEQAELKFEIIKLRKEIADLHIELLECKAGRLTLAAKVEQPVPQADRWGFLPELETTDSSTS